MSQNALSLAEAGKLIDIENLRADFPTLDQQVSGQPLVYLDSGASSQKPNQVIEAVADFYRHDYSNVHRGIHTLSQRATDHFEAARETVKNFINADSIAEIIFTSGTTESINLVAQSYGRSVLKAGDEILITAMEHHSNIVPWQLLCEQVGAVLKVVPINDKGEVIVDEYRKLLSEKTKLVAFTQLSNALGTITPIEQMISDARKLTDAKILIDGAQAIAHAKVDVQQLDCDFYAFSGHKAFAPTGIGILYGKQAILESMPPYQAGGEMIKVVSFEGSTYNELPHKFEAGTPNIAGVVGLGAGLNYLSEIGIEKVAQYEHALLDYATQALLEIDGLRIIGTAENKASIISFEIEGAHAADLGTLLDHQGVAVRVGHHCAMPVMQFFGVDATTRASLAMYNNQSDIDALVKAINKAKQMLG